jgi:hypothetical protein
VQYNPSSLLFFFHLPQPLASQQRDLTFYYFSLSLFTNILFVWWSACLDPWMDMTCIDLYCKMFSCSIVWSHPSSPVHPTETFILELSVERVMGLMPIYFWWLKKILYILPVLPRSFFARIYFYMNSKNISSHWGSAGLNLALFSAGWM